MHVRDVVIAGDDVAVRGRVIEHFGDDLQIEFTSPSGSTRVCVGKAEIVDRIAPRADPVASIR